MFTDLELLFIPCRIAWHRARRHSQINQNKVAVCAGTMCGIATPHDECVCKSTAKFMRFHYPDVCKGLDAWKQKESNLFLILDNSHPIQSNRIESNPVFKSSSLIRTSKCQTRRFNTQII